jgi:restriction system protein
MAALVAAANQIRVTERTRVAIGASATVQPPPATASAGVGGGDVAITPGKGELNLGWLVKLPELLIPATILVTGDQAAEGQLIEAVAVPWFEIIKQMQRDPDFLDQLDWRKLEELIAGAYTREGWPEVILTPRSGDGGRDVIASKPGLGAIRIYDQVKAYKPEHNVPAKDVRELLGVLTIRPNVSKAVVTTTALFAPGVYEEMKELVPYRLELKDRPKLHEWLMGLGPR